MAEQRAGYRPQRGLRAFWDFGLRCLREFIALEGLDRALVIAAQAFVALIPLLLLVSALLPQDDTSAVANAFISRFHLSGDAADSVEALFARPPGSTTSIGIASLVLLLFSGLSFTRRLQRLYERVWRLPPTGPRGSLNAALGLAVLLVEVVLLYLLRTLIRGLPLDRLLLVPVSAVAGLVLWTSIPWLLLARRLDWRRLLPSGALASLATALYGVATSIYMPSLIERYSERYGLFGITVALIGWLLCISVVLVVSAVIGVVLDRSEDPWARALLGWVVGTASRVTRRSAETGPATPKERLDDDTL